MYASGDGVPKDYAEAERLYRKYAEMLRAKAGKDLFAAYELAELLDVGDVGFGAHREGGRGLVWDVPGVPRDHDEAVRLYIFAAEQGQPNAWAAAGGLYERGDGVAKDLVKAYFYYNLSAAYFASFPSYREDRDRVEKLLTPDQVAEGQALSRKWQEEHGGAGSLAAMRPPTPTANGAGAPAGGVAAEISQVAQGGRYTPLPVSAHCIPHPGPDTSRTIENGTSYQLRLIFGGPVEREATIAPGQKQSIDLPAGRYKVVGRVTAPNVLPFYGEETYKSGEECAVQFYVR
jgi:hypothetical protein